MQWYQYLLIGSVALSLWQGGEPLRRAALVMLANAVIMTGWFYYSGNNANIGLALAVDIISAAIIMRKPAGREQGWLGMSYGFQIGCHISALYQVIRGFAMVDIEYFYWQILNYAFLLQLAILLSWGESSGGKLVSLIDRIDRLVFHRRQGGKAGVR